MLGPDQPSTSVSSLRPSPLSPAAPRGGRLFGDVATLLLGLGAKEREQSAVWDAEQRIRRVALQPGEVHAKLTESQIRFLTPPALDSSQDHRDTVGITHRLPPFANRGSVLWQRAL